MFSGEVSPRLYEHEAYQGERNAGVRFPGRNDVRYKRQKDLKTISEIGLCENSEENAVFVPLPLSDSDAPHSEYRAPIRVQSRQSVKSCTKRRNQYVLPVNRDTRAKNPADCRPIQNNALRRTEYAALHIHYTTGRKQNREENCKYEEQNREMPQRNQILYHP